MALSSSVSAILRRACMLAIAGSVAAGASPVSAQGAAAPPARTALPTPPPAPAAVADFQQRLTAYLELRTALAKKLKPLSPTASAAELTARQEALAAALRAARHGARQGDLIPPAAARHIAEVVTADFRRRNPLQKAAALKEVPETPRPVINRAYPVDAALPTVPPLLLASLPKLPDNLQYRFFGRHIAILDGDVQIIIDFVPNALPAH